jgi:hypothetical protein
MLINIPYHFPFDHARLVKVVFVLFHFKSIPESLGITVSLKWKW